MVLHTSAVPVICLMGPTASGKTALAVNLVQHFPCEIISVDSAMVYRGMDIGTAKPDSETLRIAPHRLINIVDPKDPYSAGQFRIDALREIEDIIQQKKIPLLVGGTMMYFRILQQGLAALPHADAAMRASLQARAEIEGWHALHAELAQADREAANRIDKNDGQRIQRALEVFLLTGKTITSLQVAETNPLLDYHMHSLALMPSDRALLHERIAERFQGMLALGFMEEARHLYDRGDLTPDLPSIRSVGYRQAWEHFSGQITYSEMCEKAVIATRQLAKRQMTWLRSWPDVELLPAESNDVFDRVAELLGALRL